MTRHRGIVAIGIREGMKRKISERQRRVGAQCGGRGDRARDLIRNSMIGTLLVKWMTNDDNISGVQLRGRAVFFRAVSHCFHALDSPKGASFQ